MDHGHEGIDELISRYGLEEDEEHLIIPITLRDGSKGRCFLLKRRFMRIVFSDTQYHDYPLGEVVEAIVTYQDRPLRETILLVHREPEEAEDSREERDEKEDSD